MGIWALAPATGDFVVVEAGVTTETVLGSGFLVWAAGFPFWAPWVSVFKKVRVSVVWFGFLLFRCLPFKPEMASEQMRILICKF